MVGCILLDTKIAEAHKIVEIETVLAAPPREVQLVVVPTKIDWTKDRVAEEIRTVFPEQPELAIAVFKCESGLIPTAKGPTSDFGIAQIHSPSWDREAKRLGYGEYKTDVKHNLKMARHIYDNAGGTFRDWVCYTRKMY